MGEILALPARPPRWAAFPKSPGPCVAAVAIADLPAAVVARCRVRTFLYVFYLLVFLLLVFSVFFYNHEVVMGSLRQVLQEEVYMLIIYCRTVSFH